MVLINSGATTPKQVTTTDLDIASEKTRTQDMDIVDDIQLKRQTRQQILIQLIYLFVILLQFIVDFFHQQLFGY